MTHYKQPEMKQEDIHIAFNKARADWTLKTRKELLRKMKDRRRKKPFQKFYQINCGPDQWIQQYKSRNKPPLEGTLWLAFRGLKKSDGSWDVSLDVERAVRKKGRMTMAFEYPVTTYDNTPATELLDMIEDLHIETMARNNFFMEGLRRGAAAHVEHKKKLAEEKLQKQKKKPAPYTLDRRYTPPGTPTIQQPLQM